MTEPTISCPNCQAEIKLTESLAAPLVQATRRDYEQKLLACEAEFLRRETSIREQKASLEAARKSIDGEIAAKLETERTRIATEEATKARILLNATLENRTREIEELQRIIADRNAKLADAQHAQAEALRKQREFEDAHREIEVTIEKRVQASLGVVRDKAKQDANEDLRLKVIEKEEQIASMQRQIEELRRKSEQGSQQLQGEVQELQLESLLRLKFPQDTIEPVAKGDAGGDLLHRVFNSFGNPCGTILWESKRTKHWSDAWLSKLRDDQRTAKAEIALIVTQALPKGVDAFDFVDGVWVTETRCAIPVAIALRQSLVELALARQAADGQQTKMELVYAYLTGPRFRQRIEAIVEKFSEMQEDLERERKAMSRLWAKREGQIRGVIEATVGMYGDLQGIAGRTLQEIDSLDIRLLGGTESGSKIESQV
jgi:hypothetical protein